ncbi:hypothetical protein FDH38_gp021 [Dinoroseobacter phage vB_DshS-R5C]|uniref:Uncharacterized protein n=1 Tax=Dinoroseobacter phage vB_DshS-R5C TaxID=1965368 RepID=A0A1V0DY46_9CAUD|nr:hypothetical protein FDH38_gp021 [Dinoroseobacter phage vB_DshS-R5C]ARB06075.1 hypothetical protein vBDshSR5C_21 [Dinoroseobacter phage vB_DshS-R5C]
MIDPRLAITWIKQEAQATWLMSSVIDRVVAAASVAFLALDMLQFNLFGMIMDAVVVAYVWHTVRERVNG